MKGEAMKVLVIAGKDVARSGRGAARVSVDRRGGEVSREIGR